MLPLSALCGPVNYPHTPSPRQPGALSTPIHCQLGALLTSTSCGQTAAGDLRPYPTSPPPLIVSQGTARKGGEALQMVTSLQVQVRDGDIAVGPGEGSGHMTRAVACTCMASVHEQQSPSAHLGRASWPVEQHGHPTSGPSALGAMRLRVPSAVLWLLPERGQGTAPPPPVSQADTMPWWGWGRCWLTPCPPSLTHTSPWSAAPSQQLGLRGGDTGIQRELGTPSCPAPRPPTASCKVKVAHSAGGGLGDGQDPFSRAADSPQASLCPEDHTVSLRCWRRAQTAGLSGAPRWDGLLD